MVKTLLPNPESSLSGLPEERRFARLRPSIFEAGHPPSQAPTARLASHPVTVSLQILKAELQQDSTA